MCQCNGFIKILKQVKFVVREPILLIKNNVEMLSSVKAWLFKQFEMKELGKAAYILGIKLIRD